MLVDFDFTLEAGEFVVVTGPSGAGKSTLLHIAGGLDAPDSGTIAVAGQDVWAGRIAPRRNRVIRMPCASLGKRTDGGLSRFGSDVSHGTVTAGSVIEGIVTPVRPYALTGALLHLRAAEQRGAQP